MKKVLAVTVAAFFAVALSGCAKNSQDSAGTDNIQQQKQEQAQVENNKDNFMVNSIKDAMGLGQKMKCTYTVEQDGDKLQAEAFVDGKKYKSVSQINGQTMHAVFDGETTYTWTNQNKQGMKIGADCLEQNKNQMQEQQQEMNKEEVQQQQDPFDGAVDVKCEKVNSIDFSLPADVEFADQCAMIQQQQQQMQQLQQNMPEGMELPEGMNMPSAQ